MCAKQLTTLATMLIYRFSNFTQTRQVNVKYTWCTSTTPCKLPNSMQGSYINNCSPVPMAKSRKEIQYTLHDHADLSFHCHFQWMLLKIDNSPKSGLVPPSTHRDRPGGRGDVYSDYHLTNPCRQQPARRFVTVLPSLCLAVLQTEPGDDRRAPPPKGVSKLSGGASPVFILP